MPPSGPESFQDLEFPPVRVNHSLTKLDLDTLMMRSTTRRQPEEPGSSLDDSTYELLGDSLLEASDDEAHTESIASTDGPTPDDASDFSDDDNDYETGNRELQDSTYSSHASVPGQPHDLHPAASGEDSTLTEVPPHMEESESSRKIRLQEQSTQDSDVVVGSKVIKSLPDQASRLPQVLGRYGCSEVRLVVRAALSQRPIPTPDSYRILYIGMPEKWLEDVITSQIGAALTASPSVSRSVMVRGQIEPFGPVIHVYRCAELHTFAQHEKQSHVLIILDDGKQLKFGPGLSSNSEGRPDLVVFCHPTIPDSATDLQEFASASEVFARENIPCIDLAQARPYGEGAPVYDLKSLRVAVEGRNDSKTDYELKEVLPLDYYTFSELDPSQLNRHLALISPHLFSELDTKHSQEQGRSFFAEIYDSFLKNFNSQWQLAKMLVPVLILSILLPALLQGTAYAPMFFHKAFHTEVQSPISLQASALTSSVVPDAMTHQTSQIAVPISSIPSVSSTSRDLTLVPPQAKPNKWKTGKNDEKVDHFEIQTTGDHQFVLRPSKHFANGRRKPQLQIQVAKGSQPVPARYNRTISGDYIVDLEQEYPISTFNVSIATHSKPLLRQSFEITLGNNKSTLARLLHSARENFNSLHISLLNSSSMITEHLRAGVADVEAAALLWTHNTCGSSQDVTEGFRSAKQVIQQKFTTSSEMLSQLPEVAWKGLRQATAPVRTSGPMLRARMNALRLRCKMEMATGWSSRHDTTNQSWACSKVWTEGYEKSQ